MEKGICVRGKSGQMDSVADPARCRFSPDRPPLKPEPEAADVTEALDRGTRENARIQMKPAPTYGKVAEYPSESGPGNQGFPFDPVPGGVPRLLSAT